MTTADPILSLRDLRVEIPTPRGVVKAVDGVTLDVPRGGALGLVGESGCGKSMTLRAILGLLPGRAHDRRRRGRVRRRGALRRARSARLRGDHIGMVFQEPMTALNPVMRVGEQIAEGPRVRLGQSAARGARAGARAAAPGRHPRPRAPLPGLPARALGRPAPAHRDRDRAGLRAEAAALRRADDGARRHDPGSDPAPARAPARGDRASRRCSSRTTSRSSRRPASAWPSCTPARIVETGTVAEVFGAPRHPYTRALLRSVPDFDERRAHLESIAGMPPDLVSPPSGCRFHPRCDIAHADCATIDPPLDRRSSATARPPAATTRS